MILQLRHTIRYIQLLLLLSVVGMTKANPVEFGMARKAGFKFMNANRETPLRNVDDLQWVATYRTNRGDAAFHVFNIQKGFVIVAADDCAMPVLGYSNESQFDTEDIPIQLQDYLLDFVEQIQYGIENQLETDEATMRQWELVLTTGRLTEQESRSVVAPMLTDTWHQVCYYNDKCPEDSNGPCGHTFAGCVATSFAQIMHYWGYPVSGMGSHSYKPSRYPRQTVDFGATTYDWANMPDSLTSSSTPEQINAVSTLMWHCGVAVDMEYGANVSSAYSSDIPQAIKKYFGYSKRLNMVFRQDYSNENWLMKMKNSLWDGCPIQYSSQDANGGGGHAFVCDGFDSNNLLHFNWGWGGTANGYYSINAINPVGHAYTISNAAIVNIQPDCTPGTSVQISAAANPSNGGTVSGMETFDCGEVCTLTATSNEGYILDYWTKEDEVVSCLATCDLFVTDTIEYVANFHQVEGIAIGEATYANSFLPTCDYQSLSEQIYTAEELGMGAGEISSIAFFNAGYFTYRDFSIYMVNTTKAAFEGPTDWISVTESDLVFSGEVTINGKNWTTIYFDTPFQYDGSSNVALIVDDNKNSINEAMRCRTFSTNVSQALCIHGSGTNYNPYNPASYSGTMMSEKNQIIFGVASYDYMVSVSAHPEEGGTVSGGGGPYYYGQSIPISAVPSPGYVFSKWTKNDADVSYISSDCVPVTETSEYVAHFRPVDGIVIGSATYATSSLPISNSRYSLTQQIYTANEMGNEAHRIYSVAFFNASAAKTRDISVYMVHTTKSAFTSPTNWISVDETNLVFSGSVTLTARDWTTIYFDTPFNYNGTSNLALIIDDNTNLFCINRCRTFDANGTQALRISGSGTNYNPYNTSGYSGTLLSVKNQVVFGIAPPKTFTKEINAYTEDGGYYLLSAPFSEINPTEVGHMFDNAYDLYAYDQSQELEWINYKARHFNFEAGQGYLYANNEDVTLSFTGTPYSGNGVVTLHKTGDAATAGWNLVGNPFTQAAYIDRDFYVINTDGSEIVAAERNYIEPLEGIFVVANENGETLTFSTTALNKGANLTLNLSMGGPSTFQPCLETANSSTTAVIDRAIIRFDEGQVLPKFQINENSTKLFIQQDGKDYAVVNVGRDGVHTVSTIDINFKAKENGTYTLSFVNESIEFSYLHLVDDLTGVDIDLLQQSSYTFEALGQGQEMQFKLIYKRANQ